MRPSYLCYAVSACAFWLNQNAERFFLPSGGVAEKFMSQLGTWNRASALVILSLPRSPTFQISQGISITALDSRSMTFNVIRLADEHTTINAQVRWKPAFKLFYTCPIDAALFQRRQLAALDLSEDGRSSSRRESWTDCASLRVYLLLMSATELRTVNHLPRHPWVDEYSTVGTPSRGGGGRRFLVDMVCNLGTLQSFSGLTV